MIEKEILGCFIKDNTLIEETIIQPKHFSNEAYKLLFQSMLKLVSEGKKVDKVTLLADNYDYIQKFGGTDFVTGIESVGEVDNFETYEREFIDQLKQEQVEKTINHWLSSKEKDTDKLITQLQKLDELGISEEKSKDDVLKDMFGLPYLENASDSGITSGLSDLDSLTGKFQNQNSYILGARPSVGKSATMLKFALEASKAGSVPLIFSLEMSKESLIKRMISTVGNINLFLTNQPHKLTESKKESWQYAVNELFKLDFEIYDKSMQTIQYIRSQVRKAQSKHKDKQVIVLIDYLTLIHSTEKFQSDHSKFTDISARLKAIAKDYDCPVITLAQLSRGVEQRNDKRPMLSDLRESGSIEQD